MKIRNNQDGMVLMIVTVFAVIVAALVVGFMSRNVSQILTAGQEVSKLQAESVLQGAMWKGQMALMTGGALVNHVETVNGTDFHVYYQVITSGGPLDTNILNTRVSY